MILPVVWSDEARNDSSHIIGYITERNPLAARRLMERTEDAVVSAAQHPKLYRQGRVLRTREIVVHPNYIVVYQVGSGQLEVLSVLHARRQYP